MKEFEGRIYSDGIVEYTIHKHIGVLKTHDSGWRREINLVSWNDKEPKIDIREWSPDHERMSRGITLTETEAEKLVKALSDRYRQRSAHSRSTPKKEDLER